MANEKINAAIAVLQDAAADAATHLEGLPNLQMNVKATITKLVGLLAGVGNVRRTGAGPVRERKPLTHIAGTRIAPAAPIEPTKYEPQPETINSYREQVEEATELFMQLPAHQLRKLYDDTVIRGVAVNTGMVDVSPTNPGKITIAFIETVKSAVGLRAVLDTVVAEAAENGTVAGDKIAEEVAQDESSDDAEAAFVAAKIATQPAIEVAPAAPAVQETPAPAPTKGKAAPASKPTKK